MLPSSSSSELGPSTSVRDVIRRQRANAAAASRKEVASGDGEVLAAIAENDPRMQTISVVEGMMLLLQNPPLYDAFLDAQRTNTEDSWKTVGDLLLELCPLPIPAAQVSEIRSEPTAAVKAWGHPFKGPAPTVLWHHIREYATHSSYCSVVQSSGTGKSRCVDELSKEHPVVPINIGIPSNGGFPASDVQPYKYLVKGYASTRMDVFLCALFEELNDEIENGYVAGGGSETGSLAVWLRGLMTEGQSDFSQGARRVAFYDKVTDRAESKLYTISASDLAKHLRVAVVALEKTCLKAEACKPWELQRPFIVLVFDNAQTLASSDIGHAQDEPDAINGESSPIALLRYALRSLGSGVFSLFVSSSTSIVQSSSALPYYAEELDPSARVIPRSYRLAPAFTALGWDLLVQPVTGLRFEDIGFKFQIYLGRPLFGSHYHALSSQESQLNSASPSGLLNFAVRLLLDHHHGTALMARLTENQKKACLAQRLPLEFKSRRSEQQQVQNHLRVCLTIQDDHMVSLASSEPILSDAASYVMREHSEDFLASWTVSRDLRISAGFIGMLLATLARDAVVQQDLCLPENPGFFPVFAFLKKLFVVRDSSPARASVFGSEISNAAPTDGSPSFPDVEDILRSKPSIFCDDSVKDTPLEEAFAGVYMHFNHFIERGQPGLDLDQLLMFFVRNAAFTGANSQSGIDFGFALCKGCRVMRTSTSVFLVQVTNDPTFSDSIFGPLFDMMDPAVLGIVGPDDVLRVPIIRVVMALAGSSPALKCVRTQRKGNFTAYDIWTSGLGAEVYSSIGEQESVWEELLRESRDGWKDVYDGQEAKMAMTPTAGDEDAFWS